MATFRSLPAVALDSIAMNLDLHDYLNFRLTCVQTWCLFGCEALEYILKDLEALTGEQLKKYYQKCQLETCHYISRGHILSTAFRISGGATSALDILIQRGASLKFVPCGDLIECATASNDYERQLSWLTFNGASYREVSGGINRLCQEYYDRNDLKKFRWLFSNGASLDILAETVSKVPNRPGPRTVHALRYHRDRLIKALRAEGISRGPRKIPRVSRKSSRISRKISSARHALVQQ